MALQYISMLMIPKYICPLNSFDPNDPSIHHLKKLEDCFKDIRSWMTHNFLKMNSSKTEIIELHGKFSPFDPIQMFTLDNCQIHPSSSAKNLRFIFDKHLNLQEQINNISKICYMNLRNLNRIGSKLS